MHLENVAKHLKNRSEQRRLRYVLGAPVGQEVIAAAEQRLGITLPQQVAQFYGVYNGLSIEEPRVEILALEHVDYLLDNYLHFATIDGTHRVCFDTSHVNEAQQWDIVTTDGYRITFTMASFWSNKLWAWVDKKRTIWEPGNDE
jgi:cell wall assembly regulator SMI1